MKTHLYSLAIICGLLCLPLIKGMAQVWTAQDSRTRVDLYVLALADSLGVWALGKNDDSGISDNFNHSTDQGRNWTPGAMGSTGLEVQAAHAFSDRHLLAAGKHTANQEGGFVAETFDGGLSWIIDRAFPQPLLGMCFVDSLHGWIAGRQGYLASTQNGGATWHVLSRPVSRDLHAICFVDSLNGWIAGDNGTLYRSTDGGNSWTQTLLGTSRDLYALDFSGGGRGWAAGSNGTLIATTDGGQTWQTQASGTGRDLHAIDFISPTEGWAAGDNGTVIRTTDGGLSWQPEASGTSRDILDLKMYSAILGWFCGDQGTVHIYNGRTTAISSLSSPIPVQVFPNPFPAGQDYITINVPIPACFSLIDLNGKVVLSSLFCPEGLTLLNLGQISLLPGIYLFQLEAGPAIIAQGRLLVQ